MRSRIDDHDEHFVTDFWRLEQEKQQRDDAFVRLNQETKRFQDVNKQLPDASVLCKAVKHRLVLEHEQLHIEYLEFKRGVLRLKQPNVNCFLLFSYYHNRALKWCARANGEQKRLFIVAILNKNYRRLTLYN